MTHEQQRTIDELAEAVPERLRREWRARMVAVGCQIERDSYEDARAMLREGCPVAEAVA